MRQPQYEPSYIKQNKTKIYTLNSVLWIGGDDWVVHDTWRILNHLFALLNIDSYSQRGKCCNVCLKKTGDGGPGIVDYSEKALTKLTGYFSDL